MQPLIEQLLNKFHPKVKSLLRMKHLYSISTLIGQVKTHIWSEIEYHNGAIINAKTAERQRMDKMQCGFLYEICIDDTQALSILTLLLLLSDALLACWGFCVSVY